MANAGSSVHLRRILDVLDELLRPQDYTDHSWNGLQVDARTDEVSKVGLAVDAGLSVIQSACEQSCDLLITHHGLYWGNPDPRVTGATGEKVRALLSGGCSLYCSHLPLDGNLKVGNAVGVAEALDLREMEGAFDYEGSTVGVTGTLKEPMKRDAFVDYVFSRIIPSGDKGITYSLLFGPDEVSSVGIATGSASSLIAESKRLGCDAFITGEPKQEAYHTAKEEQVNAIFAGHYFTETFGVKAIGEYLEETVKISSVFLDEPTGI